MYTSIDVGREIRTSNSARDVSGLSRAVKFVEFVDYSNRPRNTEDASGLWGCRVSVRELGSKGRNTQPTDHVEQDTEQLLESK